VNWSFQSYFPCSAKKSDTPHAGSSKLGSLRLVAMNFLVWKTGSFESSLYVALSKSESILVWSGLMESSVGG
jgi:hypothetical protein